MIRRPPRSTRTDTLFPYTTLFRSAKGVMFITIENETGIANLIVWPRMFEENRRVVMGARLLGIYGQVQREGEVVHVIVKKLMNLSDVLDTLTQRDASFRSEERRVGKECVSTCRSRWSPYH